MSSSKFLQLPTPSQALPGRTAPMQVTNRHYVNGHVIKPPVPGMQSAVFALGCFWGAERKFWQTPGVYTTAVGYAGGVTPNPTYREVCSGMTGHTEVMLVVYDPQVVSYEGLLKIFWEAHNPTQGMRQGNDVGTQYRSAIYTFDDAQLTAALASRDAYQALLHKAGYGAITTEIQPAPPPGRMPKCGEFRDAQEPPFFYAEDEHQQYLAKNPDGYCGLGGTGVACSAEIQGVFIAS